MLLCMTWWEYVKRHAPSNRTQAAIATSAGVDQTTISRWEKGAIPSPQMVIQTARKFGTQPVSALMAAGYITTAEAHATVTHVVTEELTDEALVDLISNRLKGRGSGALSTAATNPPVSATGDPELDAIRASDRPVAEQDEVIAAILQRRVDDARGRA